MILITLGTQDKQFTRLLNVVQNEIDKGNIKDKVIVQAGHTKFESNDMTFLSSEDLNANEKYEIVNFHKKTIECRELHDSNSDNKSFERGTYLTVVSKKNGIHSLISIFFIDKLGSLNLLQRINVKIL